MAFRKSLLAIMLLSMTGSKANLQSNNNDLRYFLLGATAVTATLGVRKYWSQPVHLAGTILDVNKKFIEDFKPITKGPSFGDKIARYAGSAKRAVYKGPRHLWCNFLGNDYKDIILYKLLSRIA